MLLTNRRSSVAGAFLAIVIFLFASAGSLCAQPASSGPQAKRYSFNQAVLPTPDNRYQAYKDRIVWPARLPLASECQEYYSPRAKTRATMVNIGKTPTKLQGDFCSWMHAYGGWGWRLLKNPEVFFTPDGELAMFLADCRNPTLILFPPDKPAPPPPPPVRRPPPARPRVVREIPPPPPPPARPPVLEVNKTYETESQELIAPVPPFTLLVTGPNGFSRNVVPVGTGKVATATLTLPEPGCYQVDEPQKTGRIYRFGGMIPENGDVCLVAGETKRVFVKNIQVIPPVVIPPAPPSPIITGGGFPWKPVLIIGAIAGAAVGGCYAAGCFGHEDQKTNTPTHRLGVETAMASAKRPGVTPVVRFDRSQKSVGFNFSFGGASR